MRIQLLRYPGGKSRLYKPIKEFIKDNNLKNKTYVEPFAGGFGLGIKLLVNGDIDKVIINDFDYRVYAFWYSVFNHPKKLIKKIKETPINIEEWKKQKAISKECSKRSILNIGFSTLYLNRTNFSGILNAGPIGGMEQLGTYKLDCRYNKDKIMASIEDLVKYKDKVEIYNKDVKDFIIETEFDNSHIINFDPPYVDKGKDLYKNFYKKEDHENLEVIIRNNLKSIDWFMTYDNHELIRKIYKNYYTKEYLLNHNAGKKKIGKELFIMPKNYLLNI